MNSRVEIVDDLANYNLVQIIALLKTTIVNIGPNAKTFTQTHDDFLLTLIQAYNIKTKTALGFYNVIKVTLGFDLRNISFTNYREFLNQLVQLNLEDVNPDSLIRANAITIEGLLSVDIPSFDLSKPTSTYELEQQRSTYIDYNTVTLFRKYNLTYDIVTSEELANYNICISNPNNYPFVKRYKAIYYRDNLDLQSYTRVVLASDNYNGPNIEPRGERGLLDVESKNT